VVPGIAQTHLAEDVALRPGYPVDPTQRQPWHRMKIAVATHDAMVAEAGPLRVLYCLEAAGTDTVAAIEVFGSENFRTLQNCLYGPMVTSEHPALCPLMSTLARSVPFFHLQRPSSRWSVPEVVDVLLTPRRRRRPATSVSRSSAGRSRKRGCR
jgi:hypothetical protein